MRHLDWPPTTGRRPEGKGLLRILWCTRPPLRNGLDLSACTYNCRSLLRDELNENLLQEVERIAFDILGMCEIRRKVELKVTWRDGSTVLLDVRQKHRSMGGIRFVASRKLSSRIFPISFTLRVSTCFSSC